MAEVSFDEEALHSFRPQAAAVAHKRSGTADWLVLHHFARDENQANMILLFFTIAVVLFSFVFLKEGTKRPPTFTAEQLTRFELMNHAPRVR